MIAVEDMLELETAEEDVTLVALGLDALLMVVGEVLEFSPLPYYTWHVLQVAKTP